MFTKFPDYSGFQEQILCKNYNSMISAITQYNTFYGQDDQSLSDAYFYNGSNKLSKTTIRGKSYDKNQIIENSFTRGELYADIMYRRTFISFMNSLSHTMYKWVPCNQLYYEQAGHTYNEIINATSIWTKGLNITHVNACSNYVTQFNGLMYSSTAGNIISMGGPLQVFSMDVSDYG